MKSSFGITLLLVFLAAQGSILAADKSKEDYIADLKSSDSATVVTAANWLGKEEVKEAYKPLTVVARESKDVKARSASAAAIGRLGKLEGKAASHLRWVVENDKSNDVVYSALLSLLNVKDFESEDSKLAVDFCEKNKKDDIFIADAVKRIREAMKK